MHDQRFSARRLGTSAGGLGPRLGKLGIARRQRPCRHEKVSKIDLFGVYEYSSQNVIAHSIPISYLKHVVGCPSEAHDGLPRAARRQKSRNRCLRMGLASLVD
jgi:hypothetical protein